MTPNICSFMIYTHSLIFLRVTFDYIAKISSNSCSSMLYTLYLPNFPLADVRDVFNHSIEVLIERSSSILYTRSHEE